MTVAARTDTVCVSMETRRTQARPADGRTAYAILSAPAQVLVIAVVQIVGTYFAARGQVGRLSLDPLAVALLAAGPLALAFRRQRPVAVLLAISGSTLLYLFLGYPYGPVFLSLVIGLFNAVTAGHRRAGWLTGAATYAGLLGAAYAQDTGPRPRLVHLVAWAAWLLVVLVVAEVARARHERAAQAAHAREEERRRQASEERLRIARELHDVLAHNISLINVQAGVALHLIDERPEQARTALSAIKQASNEALGELRGVLDVLRQAGERPPRAPHPGLAGLDGLVARTSAAGLRVRTVVEGTPRPLPVGVDLAAFRIAQEALTNVARHAGQASATVRVAYGERVLTVQVDDDGRSAPSARASAGGRGIAGMRERASALGGELEAGPRPGGGFRVLARLPLDGAAPSPERVTP
jgi:signal transduction histidine kinase